jgi:septum formation inhibitor-activating ATPase MinD
MLTIDETLFRWFFYLGEDTNFKCCLSATDRLLLESYDYEMLTRFSILHTPDVADLVAVSDLGQLLTDQSIELAKRKKSELKAREDAFRRTFEVLARALGEDAFKKFDTEKKRLTGAVLVSVFEVMALGLPDYPRTSAMIPPRESSKS